MKNILKMLNLNIFPFFSDANGRRWAGAPAGPGAPIGRAGTLVDPCRIASADGEWSSEGRPHQGVYVPRRDTSSCFNTVLGGRLFPGAQHPARFEVEERDGFYSVRLQSDDGQVRLKVVGRVARELPRSSVFRSLEEASSFFEHGSLGYSATEEPGRFDGMELRSLRWNVEPLAVEEVESSFFSNENVFPRGSVRFDSALLMRDIEHEWHTREPLCHCEPHAA